MSKQKIILVVGILLFVVLMLVFLYLNRPSTPDQTPVVLVIPTLAPTDAPIPTVDPQITSTLIFETLPTGQQVDTFDAQLHDKLQKEEMINRPDIVVAKNTPYTTDKIIVVTDFVDEHGGYFAITVSKVVEEDVKNEVNEWFKSLGLTDQAIAKLKVTYR